MTGVSNYYHVIAEGLQRQCFVLMKFHLMNIDTEAMVVFKYHYWLIHNGQK